MGEDHERQDSFQEEGIEKKSLKQRFTRKKVLMLTLMAMLLIAVSGVTVTKASDNPKFCSLCHIMQPYYQSWHESSLLANKHAAAGVACHDCHESSITSQATQGLNFISGNYKTPLDKLAVSKDFCLRCHSASGTGTPKGMTFEEAKRTTNFEESNPHASHNGAQNCTLCHSMHEQSKAMCVQCHQFKWMDQLDASWAKK